MFQTIEFCKVALKKSAHDSTSLLFFKSACFTSVRLRRTFSHRHHPTTQNHYKSNTTQILTPFHLKTVIQPLLPGAYLQRNPTPQPWDSHSLPPPNPAPAPAPLPQSATSSTSHQNSASKSTSSSSRQKSASNPSAPSPGKSTNTATPSPCCARAIGSATKLALYSSAAAHSTSNSTTRSTRGISAAGSMGRGMRSWPG